MHTKRPNLLCLVAGLLLLAPAASAQAVDDDRLLSAAGDPANWITFGQNYTNDRFSRLADIDRENIASLAPAWVYQTGQVGPYQTHPMVVDGVVYFTTQSNDVVAADAATGAQIWRYRHQFREEQTSAPRNRGVATAYGKVYLGTDDHRMIALDQATGAVLWDILVEGYDPPDELRVPGYETADAIPFAFRAAPLVHDGKVIISAAAFLQFQGGTENINETYVKDILDQGQDIGLAWISANLGARGFVVALDAETGAEAWRFYTTKEEGWEGEWKTETPAGVPLNRDIATEQALLDLYGHSWAAGAVGGHFTPSIDPELGLLFIGTANTTQQWLPLSHPGDNLYSNGMLALHTDTGELAWFFQAVPHGLNHDLITQTTLFDTVVDGQTIPAVGVGSKTGFYYVLERATGRFLFQSEPYVPQENVFAPITTTPVTIAPGDPGGSSVSPTSFDPGQGLVFLRGIHRPTTYTAMPLPALDGHPPIAWLKAETLPVARGHGTLTAMDVRNGGHIVWQVETTVPSGGASLATAGGLLFDGERNGFFRAYDSATGDLLWSFQTGSAVEGHPISYSAGGRQFVVVGSGSAMFAFALPE